MTSRRAALAAAVALAAAPAEAGFETFLGNQMAESRWFSEEDGGYSGQLLQPISAARCSGRYCDSMALSATGWRGTQILFPADHWTPFFSDSGGQDCPDGMLVSEVQCTGRYCDNLRLLCAPVGRDFRVVDSSRYETESFSEENGLRECGNGDYVSGMHCTGDYCDNMRLSCKRLEVNRPELIKAENNLCLDNPDRANNGIILFVECSQDSPDQWWIQESDGRLRVFGSNSCLDDFSQHNSGSEMVAWDCGGAAEAQQYDNVEGQLRLRLDASLCVNNEAAVAGQRVTLVPCVDGRAFSFEAINNNIFDARELALKFAPQMRFDQNCKQFPVVPREFFANSFTNGNGDRVPHNFRDSNPYNPSTMGMQYVVNRCSGEGRIVIRYWWFYEYQPPCIFSFGGHNGDWEHIVVELNGDLSDIRAVQYGQHSGWYTKANGQFERVDGTHPVVYVGKNSKGSYHDDGGSGGCLYFEDFRNQGSAQMRFSPWHEGTFDEIFGNEEWQQFRGAWGESGIAGPISKSRDECYRNHCNSDGCDKSNSAASFSIPGGSTPAETEASRASSLGPIAAGASAAVVLFAALAVVRFRNKRSAAASETIIPESVLSSSNPRFGKEETP